MKNNHKDHQAHKDLRIVGLTTQLQPTPGLFTVLALIMVLILTPSHVDADQSGLRIGIGGSFPDLTLAFPGGGDFLDGKGKKIKTLQPGERFHWSLSDKKASQTKKQPKSKTASSGLSGKTFKCRPRQGYVDVNGRGYRGTCTISFGENGASVINQVFLEDYVKGVVGFEIGSLSPIETLKAQAVIARTFGLASRGKHGNAGFDLCDGTHCQAYGGVNAERPIVNTQVDATRGVIMISEGQLISTMYHATCGGMTSNNEEVFGGKPAPYLRRVKCNYCSGGQNYRWKKRLSLETLRQQLSKENIRFDRLTSARVLSPAPLDRVDQVLLQTDRGLLKVKGTTFRRLFELPSTTFITEPSSETPEPPIKPIGPSSGPVSRANGASPIASIGFSLVNLFPGPGLLVIQSALGIKRIRRPAGGWIVLLGSSIEGTLDAPPDRRVPLREEAKDGPETHTPSMAFSGHTPPRGDSPETHTPSMAFSGHTPHSGDRMADLGLIGRGYGHQIGLCQSGAIQMGRIGWSYRQILAFYYSRVLLRIMKL